MAAKNYILVSGQTTRLNSQIRTLVDELKNVKNMANTLSATLGQANNDGAAQFATVTGLDSDDAAAIYSLISSVTTDINNSTFIAQLIARCG